MPSRESPNRPKAPGPAIPLRERGGRLDPSSLRAVAKESWLLLLCAAHGACLRSRETDESKLVVGELPPFSGGRGEGPFWNRGASGVVWRAMGGGLARVGVPLDTESGNEGLGGAVP